MATDDMEKINHILNELDLLGKKQAEGKTRNSKPSAEAELVVHNDDDTIRNMASVEVQHLSAEGVDKLLRVVRDPTANTEDYAARGTFDLALMRRMITEMRGDISVSDFAKNCGLSPSSLTRLMKGEVKIPSKSLLTACYQNADPNSNVEFGDFMRAAGYIKRRSASPMAEAIDRERRVKMIVTSSLVESGEMVSVGEMQTQNKLLIRPDFVLCTQAQIKGSAKGESTSYYVLDTIHSSSRRGTVEQTRMATSACIRNMRMVLGGLYLEHSLGNRRQLAFVVFNRGVFNNMVDYFEDLKVMDPISLICVDVAEDCIVEQYDLPQN